MPLHRYNEKYAEPVPRIGFTHFNRTLKKAAFFVILLLLSSSCFALKVGTYNIRYDNTDDDSNRNGWSQRAPIIASLIQFHDFDVLGIQEALANQVHDLRQLLPQYEFISHGRNDGRLSGEHVGILYRKDQFDVLQDGWFWLSDTPDQPSKGWDAKFPRICSWAKLKSKAGGKTICYFSVHLDHQGEVSRQQSIHLILNKIEKIAGDQPVVLTGDFNADQNSEAYRLVTRSDRLIDSASIADVCYLLNGSTSGFNPDRHTESRIDHLFVSSGVKVRRFGILTDSYRIPKETHKMTDEQLVNTSAKTKSTDCEARLPSDHFPVFAEIFTP